MLIERKYVIFLYENNKKKRIYAINFNFFYTKSKRKIYTNKALF